ncbi:MAG: helix-turn-helix transcriptional regulator [Acidobacteria bacterium]|nr:helix-turn-helix transcriptional regulator [Acidobacteriota bacterium]
MWEFIEENYWKTDLRLPEAARAAGVSRDYLNVLLRQFAGMTFRQLLNRYRVEKCLDAIRERDYSLTETSSMCGFASLTTFERHFKRWTGRLPKDYRKWFLECYTHGAQRTKRDRRGDSV